MLETAVALARRGEAHLDVLSLGVDPTQPMVCYGQGNALITQELLIEARERARKNEEDLKSRLQREEISWGCDAAAAQIDGITRIVGLRARYADLVILPQPYGEGSGHEQEAILEAALFEGHAPVLVIPDGQVMEDAPKRIVVAWNDSAEALAAIRAALPLLKDAETVSIAVVDPPQHGPDRSDPGGALSQMLARHGVRADIAVLAKTMPRVADVLARHVQDVGAGMLVMGAYGHSRFREAILGGATRDTLEASKVPVLLAR
ncbi:universal stress protein [Pseudoruegeria aquimaris]|uniref:universal stress protein n=1 Tax=Pseudoruegeria aquimaris TaxID=393663 RepID=UPI00279595CC|nr:universal stress protein [Pseudoruegeria aquimaris]